MKPMLAATVENTSALRYPLLASTKLDGIRAFVENGVVLSRNRKPIPNVHIQELYCHLEGYDGELIVGDPRSKSVYRDTMSTVMSQDVTPHELSFKVFDHVGQPELNFSGRIGNVIPHYRLPQIAVYTEKELLDIEDSFLADGYEGVMLRDPEGRYKHGRSTLNQGWLMKLKRFKDDEGIVVDFEELMHNANTAKINELGYQSRSSHQANLVPMGRLGALVVKWREHTFNIGTGFTDGERHEIWAGRMNFIGRTVKFKYLPVGMKDLPRHPVFLGWRSKGDV